MSKLNLKGWMSRRLLGTAVVAGIVAASAGCDELLSVQNPNELQEAALDDPFFADILVNSAIGEFQNAFDDPIIWRGSMFTDEQITGINWEATARLGQRIIRFDEGDASGMFGSISRALVMADTASSRLRTFLDNPQSDARLATTLAFAGYSYIYMAETMCEATIKQSAQIFTSDEIMEMAIPRFEEAIQVAQAAGNSRVENLARTGAARAHLWLGNRDQVRQVAGAVPQDFVYWANYSDNSGRETNTLNTRVTGANHALGVHPNFVNGPFLAQDLVETQTDPRIQHWTRWRTGHNALSPLYTPYAGRRFSNYTGEAIADGGTPASFERTTNIAMADGIEARHHYAEADGPTAATLAFVNERRAYGNQPPLENPTDAELMEALREQRGRDTYLSGLRLGDLRRWKAQGVGDFFPSGEHPTAEWGLYGDAECFPLPLAEFEGNPNLPLPGSR